jgi:hypothetical protein
MSNKTMFWYRFFNYLILLAAGIFMIYSIASTYSRAVPASAEPAGNKSDYSEIAGSEIYNPYVPELKDIFFNPNSFAIREDAKPVLNENAKVLKKEQDAFVVIESYCGTREEPAGKLGAERADSVKKYLIEKGVDSDRVITANKCNSFDMQFVNGKDIAGLNSRVHFVTLDKVANRNKLASAG